MGTLIQTLEEYEFCLKRGHDALVSPHFILDLKLRVQIQKRTFGKCEFGRGDIRKANQRYYYYMWENSPHVCENCQKPLYEDSAYFISHIYSKGRFPEMAHDPRNVNILCRECHNKWEFEIEEVRKGMRIFPRNKMIMEMLVEEYTTKQVNLKRYSYVE